MEAPSAPPIAQPVPTLVAHRLSMAAVMHHKGLSTTRCNVEAAPVELAERSYALGKKMERRIVSIGDLHAVA